MNDASEISHHLQSFQKTMDAYLTEDITSCTLVTDDFSDWKDVTFPPLVQFSSFNCSVPITSKSYLFDVRKNNEIEKCLKVTSISVETKFIIVVSEETHSRIVQQILTMNLCSVLVTTVTRDNLQTYKISDSCKGVGDGKNMTRKECLHNVSALSLPPASFFLEDGNVTGYEAVLFRTVANHMGLNVRFLNLFENVGTIEPPDGALGDVIRGKSIATFGVLYPFASRFDYLDMIPSCYKSHITWAVPSQAGKRHPTWFVILVTEFSPSVWISLFLTFLVLVMGMTIVKYQKKQGCSFIGGTAKGKVQQDGYFHGCYCRIRDNRPLPDSHE